MLAQSVTASIASGTFTTTDTYASVVPSPNREGGQPNFGEPNTHILVTGAASPAYQEREGTPEEVAALVGRVLAVRPNRTRTSWYYHAGFSNAGSGAYLLGPEVNPTPVNGHHYRELMPTGSNANRSPYVLRYNDEDHRGDRHDHDFPWTLVHNNLLPSDGPEPRYANPDAYIEIQWPAPLAGATDEELDLLLSEEDAAPTPLRETMTNESTNPRTFGLAVVEDDGLVTVKPPLVEGQAYMVWDTSRIGTADRTPVGFLVPGTETIYPFGYYYAGADGGPRWIDDAYQNPYNTGTATARWVKLAPAENSEDAEDAATRAETLLEQRRTEFESFEDLNDALNELANDHDWCGEYERTMGVIGMRARRGTQRPVFNEDGSVTPVITRHAYDVEVEVSFSGEIDYVRGGLESAVEDAAGFSGSVSSVRFDGNTTVTIEGVVADDDDEARSIIESSQVEDAMDSAGISYSDIDDWNVTDATENMRFDWEEYDENNS